MSESFSFKDSYYYDGDKKWLSSSLYDHAEKYGSKEIDIDLSSIDITGNWFEGCSRIADIAFHVKRVLSVDPEIPILVSADGKVLDGRHRIVRAIVCGQESIKAIQIESMPEPDCLMSDDEAIGV